MTQNQANSSASAQPVGLLPPVPPEKHRARIIIAYPVEGGFCPQVLNTQLAAVRIDLGLLPFHVTPPGGTVVQRHPNWRPDLITVEYGLSPTLDKDSLCIHLPQDERLGLHARMMDGPYLALVSKPFENQRGVMGGPDGKLLTLAICPENPRLKLAVKPGVEGADKATVEDWLTAPEDTRWMRPFNPLVQWGRYFDPAGEKKEVGVRIGFRPVWRSLLVPIPPTELSSWPGLPEGMKYGAYRLDPALFVAVTGTDGAELLGAIFISVEDAMELYDGVTATAAARLFRDRG